MREQSWRPVSPSCAMDRLATRTDALNRQESYEYDPAGNLAEFTDRKNQQSTFGYDALNRRIGATYANGRSRSFVYDAVGRLTRALDSMTGTIEFAYDALDRLIKEVGPKGLVTYVYDALGRRTAMTPNGAQSVSYQYDAASRLTQVAQGSQIVGLGYDAAGRRTSLTYPNGTNTSYAYDNASRLTNIVHTGPAGLIESLTYAYDAAGNRISLTRTNGTATLLPAAVQAAYDAANQQIQFNAASPNHTFDANGNLTSDGVNTYTWDALNQLEAISGPGLSASFEYDALGRRLSKTINGVTTSYLYDGNEIVQEIGGGAVGASYVRSLNTDEAFVRQSTGNEFYHADALGSTLALSNTAGVSAVSYSFAAFGKVTSTGTSSNPFQYTGRENDETGLYFYRARYYSPRLKRFLSEDPVRLSGRDINFYSYVRNNPTNYMDPSGLRQCPCGLQATAAAAVGLYDAYRASQLRFDAFNVTNQVAAQTRMNPGDLVNSPLDAFRHCYWSCRMSQTLGRDQAAIVGNVYEDCARENQDENEFHMDFYNNLVGRTFGMPGSDCRSNCVNSMQNGVLQTFLGPPVPPEPF